MKPDVRWGPLLLTLAWPAFLAACLLEVAVFAFVDPLDLHWSGASLNVSRQGVYTIAFFVFWAITFAACVLSTVLRMTSVEINDYAAME